MLAAASRLFEDFLDAEAPEGWCDTCPDHKTGSPRRRTPAQWKGGPVLDQTGGGCSSGAPRMVDEPCVGEFLWPAESAPSHGNTGPALQQGETATPADRPEAVQGPCYTCSQMPHDGMRSQLGHDVGLTP